jgi:hypothetical protein
MTEPRTTGEAIQLIRAALYDLGREPGSTPLGLSEKEILAYCRHRGWPVPEAEFDRAIGHMHRMGAVELNIPEEAFAIGDEPEPHYLLSPSGDLEEEAKRRGWLAQVLDELSRPRTFVDLLFALLGFALGLVSGVLLSAPATPL